MMKRAVGKIRGKELLMFSCVLLACAGLVAAAVYLIPRLQMSYSLRQFLPPQHPLMKNDDETKKRFSLGDLQPVLVTLDLPEGRGDWLEASRLKNLETVTQEFNKREHVTRAFSVGTLSLASQTPGELVVGKLADIADPAARRERLTKDHFLVPTLVSESLRSTLVVIYLDDQANSPYIEKLVIDLRATFGKSLPEAHVSVGGVPAIQTRLTGLVREELKQFLLMALIASCLTLLFVFADLWAVIIPFVAIVVANIYVLAFMAWAGITMTVLSVTIPILVSISVLSLVAHTMLRFVEEVSRGVTRERKLSLKASLVMETVRAMFFTNFMTCLTTCFGFATLLLTNVPVIRQFGLTVAVAIMMSLVSTTLLLAPLLALLPVPRVRRWVVAEANWTAFVFKYKRSIIASVSIVCIVMAICGQNLHWSARLFDDLPPNEEARIATESIDRDLGGTIPLEVLIQANGSEPWNDPSALHKLDRTLAQIRARAQVGSAVGLPDILRQALGSPTAPIPATRAGVAESWFVLAMAEENPLKQFLSTDSTTTRLALRLRDVPADQMTKVVSDVVKDVAVAFPNAKVSSAGLASTIHVLNNELSQHLLYGFFEALAVITLLLLCIFRSWRWTMVAVLPNLVPATILIGVLALTETPIKPGVALVFSIALGIAFTNTVYLLFRLRDLIKETGRAAHELIEKALRLEGNPCLVSSVCVLAGFAIFLASEFGINRTFGAYMLISLFFGLVGDLIYLPALLKEFPSILGSTPKGPGANLKEPATTTNNTSGVDPEMENQEMKKSPELPSAAASLVFAILTVTLAASTVRAAPDAATILKTVAERMITKDESAKIKMKVIESDGATKERELEIKRKSGDKQQVLVRLQAPADVNGIGLLSISSKSGEDQWIYMPSQGKARRVVSGSKSQKFLDTEFSLEDFSANTYAHFTNEILKEERAPSAAVTVIESKAKDTTTSYSKILTWIDLASYQVQKSEYYDQNGKLLKSMVFRDYKKFGDTWRAQTIEVRNMQNNRSTVLQVASMKVNAGLKDNEFTQTALEDND